MRVRLAAFLACLCAITGLVAVIPARNATARTMWPHVVVGGFATPSGNGGWVVFADGTVSAFGDGRRFGDMAGRQLNAPIVGGAATPNGGGYWMVAADGGIFAFGNAHFFGSMGGKRLNQPVFSMAATKSGRGYWLVAYDGGIFSFGDAKYFGSLGNRRLNQPINGIITSPSGKGYRMVARDGGIFSFGDAPFYGSAAGARAADIIGMAPTPTNKGYWIARRNGSVSSYGDAPRYRDVIVSPYDPVAAIFSSPTRPGFTLVLARGTKLSFGPAPAVVNRGVMSVPTATPYDVVPRLTAASPTRPITKRYGPRTDQRVDVYLPHARFAGPRPVIVWLHSGGWIGGARSSIPAMMLRQVQRAGFVVASVDYGLAPQWEFPAPLRDVKRAIRWLKVNAKTYRIDPRNVVMAGGSAGGHLAALAGVTPGLFEPTDLTGAMTTVNSKVAGVLDFVGPTNMTTFAAADHPWAQNLVGALLHCTPRYPKPIACPPNALRDASVTSYLDATDPPIYMGYGNRDELVRPWSQGAPTAQAWANALGPSRLRVWYEVANTDHNLEQDNVNMRYLELFIDDLVARRLP